MTDPKQATPEQMERAVKAAGPRPPSDSSWHAWEHWDTRRDAALTAILQSDQQQAELREQLDVVMRHIPMDYLQRHDAPGVTGPTVALNLAAAMKDYAEDRWKLIDRLKDQAELKAHAEAMAGALEWARDQFKHYGDLHKAKGKEGHQKAAVNYAASMDMDEPLAAYRQYQEGRADVLL